MTAWPFPQRGSKPLAAAPLPRPGAGTRLTANELGFAYSVPPAGRSFNHPFRPTLTAAGVLLRFGLVEFTEPRIGDVPISGAGAAAPALKLDAKTATKNGESWVCVELTLDDAGGLLAEKFPQIVHTGAPVSRSLTLARAPLALVVWRQGKPWRAVPFAHFHLRYQRVLPPPGFGLVRHLFF